MHAGNGRSVVADESARWRRLAGGNGGVELLASRTRHEELVPAGAVLHAHVVRLAVGSRL